MRDTDDISSNRSNNPHLVDIIAERVSRRDVLTGGVAAGAASFLSACSDAVTTGEIASLEQASRHGRPLLGFLEIAPSAADTVVVPPGYVAEVFVPWGTELFDDSPAFAEDASNSAADQAKQVGFNHDAIHYFPLEDSRRGLLAINHEYTDASQIYTAVQGAAITNDAAGVEKVNKALAGHGVTIVEVRRKHNGSWTHVVGSSYNRRVTGATPMAFSGPVSETHPLLTSSVTPIPLGTLNNCGHGVTPWGTYLSGEENWNGYFGTDDATWTPSTLEGRYGLSSAGFGYNWHKASARFDLAVNGAEANRFGWVVEIDPKKPESRPVKRSALGRIKHEGAWCVEMRGGRLAVYTGDDQDGEYLYRFVSSEPWRKLRASDKSPLDHGTLYVAKFNGDGTGEWLSLAHGTGPLTVENGWLDQADVLIRTRMAADAVGATRLHRPEWVAANEKTGDLYVTFTNGTGNLSEVNRRTPNPYGHIIRWREGSSLTAFTWDVFVLAGDPAYPAGDDVPPEQSVFGSPDGLWVDGDGRVWIQTDISNSSQNRADRGYDNIGNNQMLAADPRTGEVRRFLTGPRGCEVTGVVTTPDERTMFVNIQHPGESTTYWDTLNGTPPTTSNPSTVSSWPSGDGKRARSATLVIRKSNGGKIGT